VYNSIPAEVKLPPSVAQLRYIDSFDNDFTLLLRERRSSSLDAIMSNVVEVKVNMMVLGKIKPRRQETLGGCTSIDVTVLRRQIRHDDEDHGKFDGENVCGKHAYCARQNDP
jgi:hypothetical protein